MSETVKPCACEVKKALESVDRYGDRLYPTGEDRAALCEAARILAKHVRAESSYADMRKAMEEAFAAADLLASWALSLNLRPGSNTKEFIAELYTRTLNYARASDYNKAAAALAANVAEAESCGFPNRHGNPNFPNGCPDCAVAKPGLEAAA